MGESYRMWASASFVGVLIIVGLPLWWKTTEVYRVALPYDKISSFDSLSHFFATDLTVLANDDATATAISSAIKKAFENNALIKLRIKKAVLSDQLQHTLNSMADESEALDEVASSFDLGNHNSFYVVQRKPLFQDVWLGTERLIFFRDGKASATLTTALLQWVYQTSILHAAGAEYPDEARHSRLPPGDAYHVVLSVVPPRPDKMTAVFNAEEAVNDYIGSFVDELSVLHNFTLKSQWLHLLNFDFQPREVDEPSVGRHYAVWHDRLPQLLTALEERAAAHGAGAAPHTAQLALWLAHCNHSPLVIYGPDGKPNLAPVQAFMSPKWGGVVLWSPSPDQCLDPGVTEQRVAVTPVMGALLAHLRVLVGITDSEPIAGAHIESLRSVRPRRWEVDRLLRLRTLEQITSAVRTLQSLAQLLGEISNIVINDEVGASINIAVDCIFEASALMKKGELVEAYRISQKAFQAAETAFMEPSLLALLYFPDDQKYAIYIPLFLPIMFPVVLSLKNLIQWLRGKPIHKEKAD